MNCRRVNGLLSAYLDGELTGAEMLEIRAHLDGCAGCYAEHQALRDTKRLVASLAYKTPRADLEALLADRTFRGGANAQRVTPLYPASADSGTGIRPWPIAATILLSLTGLYLASTALNAPGGEGAFAGDFVAPPLYPVITASRADDSPVALTAVSAGTPLTVWTTPTPMANPNADPSAMARIVGLPAAMASTSRSNVSVTVMTTGRGVDTVRIFSQSITGANGQMTVTSTTTSSISPFSNLMPMWQVRTNLPTPQMATPHLVLRRIGLR